MSDTPEQPDEADEFEGKDWSLDPDFLTFWRERMRQAVRRLKGNNPSARFDTSDIVQEGMMQVFRQFETFRGNTEEEFDAWIKQIAKGHTFNTGRLHRAKMRDVGNEVAGQASVQESQEQSPFEEASKREMLEQLAEAIEKLSDRQQAVLMYHMFEGLSFAKIADIVGCSAATAKRVYDRALEILSGELNDDDDLPDAVAVV